MTDSEGTRIDCADPCTKAAKETSDTHQTAANSTATEDNDDVAYWERMEERQEEVRQLRARTMALLNGSSADDFIPTTCKNTHRRKIEQAKFLDDKINGKAKE